VRARGRAGPVRELRIPDHAVAAAPSRDRGDGDPRAALGSRGGARVGDRRPGGDDLPVRRLRGALGAGGAVACLEDQSRRGAGRARGAAPARRGDRDAARRARGSSPPPRRGRGARRAAPGARGAAAASRRRAGGVRAGHRGRRGRRVRVALVALHGALASCDPAAGPAQAVTQVSLPRLDDPLVSTVMVLYGGGKVAARAISALADNTEPCFELVLVDNASPDDSLARVEKHAEGATIIRNESNRGFGGACNQGAEQARGRYLCFLNSDALVEPGWLPPLLETLEGPGVGAVAPMYLNENGTLQEAGSVVDSIGHCHMVGRDGDPRDFAHRFRREIDFGSAACMLMRAELFHELGGFDERYTPGYFEDTDLCFKLHERGLRTIYQPRSPVVHVQHG